MKLWGLTALTMLAFAANSLLNRLALAEGAIGPAGFAALRVASGAVVLLGLLALRDKRLAPPRPALTAVAGLTAYLLGFSFAYISLDAGLGALILFGTVQLTMFVGAVREGESPPVRRWAGMGCAMAGLAVLCVPREAIMLPPVALGLMGLAALGWGVYSLLGRKVSDPLAATAWNFVYSLPLVALAVLLWPDAAPITGQGALLAVLSGGVTSGLGYALWYHLLPSLGATKAALAQLSVPVLALALGALLLAEQVTPVAMLAAGMILGGIALGLAKAR